MNPIWSPPPKRKAPGLATAGEVELNTQNLAHADTDVNPAIDPDTDRQATLSKLLKYEAVYDVYETDENWTIYRRPDESDIKLAQFGAQLNAFAGEHFKGVA